ncbi:DUF6401 family natural product biosynthesis protein [Planosporangium sp. 12N6]|uniref:DUF6401 family natural product biosynthesis protein n=1 Tax=Planosporangium spinosum TaxID=3402278 RepID=UPI003CEFE622
METLLVTADPAREEARVARSRAFLDELMARVGVDGLVATLRSPSLGTAVADHAAVVRDNVALDATGIEPVELADYAAVVLADAQRAAHLLPTDPGAVDWERADWYLLRLLAVCAVAVESDCL